MITLADFTHEFEKLKRKWPRFYTSDMESEIFFLVEKCELDTFKRTIKNQMWRKLNDPPMLSDFSSISYTANSIAQAKSYTKDCEPCGNRGYVTAIPYNEMYPNGGGWTCFRCTFCPRGEDQNKTIAFWNDSYRARGFVPEWERDAEMPA